MLPGGSGYFTYKKNVKLVGQQRNAQILVYLPVTYQGASIARRRHLDCNICNLRTRERAGDLHAGHASSIRGRISCLYRVSQEECARLREGVPYVKVYRYNPKHLCQKLNGYRDNGQRKVWYSCGSTHCICQLTILSISVLECGVI